MFGMLSKKSLFLLPIILISIIIFIFHSLLIIQWITSWILLKEKIYDIDLFIIIIGFLLVEFIFILVRKFFKLKKINFRQFIYKYVATEFFNKIIF